ncbi:MAG: amidase [Alphaproteobacteria bacterium]|jgi:Asp-tRNA(Asn)/Glu-tRNA(Gln) amidotransferase A subunit family amidase|nr:amidase [Alphaproteobacteria bacterium]PPR13774.1 MAG: putative amidase AmiD [Alphaproteobacteria bacterium MarineAlpha12_Bin1]|tara:strand:- start:25507 stop:26811 length:1305 start_codon:yes stop_codon:yes gene_type:complete
MLTTDLLKLSATEIASKISGGELTSVRLIEALLSRIKEREKTVKAWAYIDPDIILDQARKSDQSGSLGLLHGVPLGIKDIIDTCDMPTQMGSPIYIDHQPLRDASCVALTRSAGALIMGKTVSTEFAGSFPGPTSNPHNPERTPGGSSSGSAAAVADYMIPVAFGTQTGSSILRPSSYCGIIGYKPTFGRFNISGIKPAAQSLDTLGLHVRNLEDIQLFTSVLINRSFKPLESPSYFPKIGICRTELWDYALPETKLALESAATNLEKSGAKVSDIKTPNSFKGLEEARILINCYERSRHMVYEWNEHRASLSEPFQDVISAGLNMSYDDYSTAMKQTEKCLNESNNMFQNLDLIIAPCVDGEAQLGLDFSGNPRFSGLWTAIRLPTLNLPTHTGPNGLPVSIQLVGKYRGDDKLLGIAKWVLQTLGSPSLKSS